MKPGERLSPVGAGGAAAEGASPRRGGSSATLGLEAGVVDLFGWFRRKDNGRRNAPAAPSRSIAQPVSAPMFTGRVEPMGYQRAPRPSPAPAPAPAQPDQPTRQDGGRKPRARKG